MNPQDLIKIFFVAYLEQVVQNCFNLCGINSILVLVVTFCLHYVVQYWLHKDRKEKIQLSEDALRRQNLGKIGVSRRFGGDATFVDELSGLPRWPHDKYDFPTKFRFLVTEDDIIYDLKQGKIFESTGIPLQSILPTASEQFIVLSFCGLRDGQKPPRGYVPVTGTESRENPWEDEDVIIGSSTAAQDSDEGSCPPPPSPASSGSSSSLSELSSRSVHLSSESSQTTDWDLLVEEHEGAGLQDKKASETADEKNS